jgi:hypothetical protein
MKPITKFSIKWLAVLLLLGLGQKAYSQSSYLANRFYFGSSQGNEGGTMYKNDEIVNPRSVVIPLYRNTTPIVVKAIDQTAIVDNYQYRWNGTTNDNIAPAGKSHWYVRSSTGNTAGLENSSERSYTIVPSMQYDGYTYVADLKKQCNVILQYDAELNGTINASANQVVSEQNTVTYDAADNITVGGVLYYFYNWQDNNSTVRTGHTVTISSNTAVVATYKKPRTISITTQTDAQGIIGTQVAAQVRYNTNGTVTAPATVSAASGTTYYFMQWSDGVTTPTRTYANVTNNLTVTAQYKGHLVSSFNNATGTSQRTLAKERNNNSTNPPPNHYLVYASNGNVYLTVSTDNGVTWQPELLVGSGKNPSVASTNGGCMIIWMGSGHVYSRYYSSTSNAIGLDPNTYQVDDSQASYPPIADAHPVAAYVDTYHHAVAVYERNNANFGQSISGLIAVYYNGSRWQGYTIVPNGVTSSGTATMNPTIDYYEYAGNSQMWLMWQTYSPYNAAAPLYVTSVNYPSVAGSSITFSPSSPIQIPMNTGQFINGQHPTIATDNANGAKYMAFEAHDTNINQDVVLYKYLPPWNDPSYALTEFVDNNSLYSPSIQWMTNGTINIFMNTGTNQLAKVNPPSSSRGQYVTTKLPLTGSHANVEVRNDNTLYAYTQTAVPYQIAFTPSNSGSGSGSGSISSSAASSTPIQQAVRVSLELPAAKDSSKTDGSFSLKLSSVSLVPSSTPTGFAVVNTPVTVQPIPDTLRLTYSNVLGLLSSAAFNVGNASSVAVTVEARTNALNKLGQNVSIQAVLYDASNGQRLSVSSPVSLTNADTVKAMTLNISTAGASLSGKSVAVRIQVNGVNALAQHRVYATNIIKLNGATSSSASGMQSNDVQAVQTTQAPTSTALAQNYPNPFNPTTTIEYALPQAAMVSLKIYDILGREVQTLVNEPKSAGFYAATFDASRLSSGTYFYKLVAGSFVQTKKMVLVK